MPNPSPRATSEYCPSSSLSRSHKIEAALTLFIFISFNLAAVSLHRYVVRQNVALGLLIQHIDIVVSQVDDPHPAARGINHHRGG